jgi:hypothetical protein
MISLLVEVFVGNINSLSLKEKRLTLFLIFFSLSKFLTLIKTNSSSYKIRYLSFVCWFFSKETIPISISPIDIFFL